MQSSIEVRYYNAKSDSVSKMACVKANVLRPNTTRLDAAGLESGAIVPVDNNLPYDATRSD
jgi:hypothetical protein